MCILIIKSRSAAQATFANICSFVAFDLLDVTPALRISGVYRPPYYDTNAEIHADMLTRRITAYTRKNQNHIIFGDLNLPRIRWNSHCCPVDRVHKLKLIYDFVLTHGYSQLVDFPTHGNNILDVIFTDDDCIVTTVKS